MRSRRYHLAMETSCKNCGAQLVGVYCHACGQKSVGDDGRRLKHLLGLFVTELTSLDGRFWRTLLGLFRPGWLSQQYLAGRRASLLTPVSVFLLVNVLYFFAPVLSDFELSFSDQVSGQIKQQFDVELSAEQRAAAGKWQGQLHSAWTQAWVARTLEQRQKADPTYSLKSLAASYDAKSADISKLLIIVQVPFLAVILFVLFWRRRMYYAEHFVVALHLFAGMLLLMQLLLPLLEAMLPVLPASAASFWRVALPALLIVYTCVALARVYAVRWWLALPASVLFLAGLLLVSLTVYRSVQFVVVFALS
jgi:Protein of unknown function (DUF3667)